MASGIRFLGSSGGREGRSGTTCVRVTPSVAIDAGNLLRGFKEEEPWLEKIFLTHAHLDHLVDIPFWLDYHYGKMKRPLCVYGSEETIKTLREKLFDGSLWPSFHEINLLGSSEKALCFEAISAGDRFLLEEGVSLEAIKGEHTEGSLGYIIQKENQAIYFTSDTYDSPLIWELIDHRPEIKQVVIDLSFPSRFAKLAKSSAHLTPKLLQEARAQLVRQEVLFHLFHLKPAYREEIIQEVGAIGLLRSREKILADGAFIPFDPAELFEGHREEPTKEEILGIIFECVGKIAQERSLERLLLLMAGMARQIVTADRCTIWMIDREKGELWTKIAHGIDAIKIPLGSGIAGYVAQKGETLVINDPYNDPRFNPEVDKKTGYLTRSIIALPIFNSEGEIIGAYQAINKMTLSQGFSQEDAKYLTLAATYTGSALESAMLYAEIEETQKEIIYTMAEIGESRSKETGFHVKRVAEYSKILALGMGLSELEAELVKVASSMHDIGKVAIPDAILKKPGKLTEEEFEVMKSHSRLGYETLKHSNRRILKAAAAIAHEHHEKWNGTGYPQGKKGEDIHLYGRIVALADVFDALGSDRCYKKAWELERIYALLEEEKGRHFDPRLIEVFFENLEEILKVREMYKEV